MDGRMRDGWVGWWKEPGGGGRFLRDSRRLVDTSCPPHILSSLLSVTLSLSLPSSLLPRPPSQRRLGALCPLLLLLLAVCACVCVCGCVWNSELEVKKSKESWSMRPRQWRLCCRHDKKGLHATADSGLIHVGLKL